MIYIGLFLFSSILTYGIRLYANKKSILDIPNERSSHTIPTPRGGGLAIILGFFLALFIFKDEIDDRLFYSLFCVVPIVIVSLIDDIKPISSLIRALTQSFSAILALYFLGGVGEIDFILFSIDGVLANILAFISIFWVTNLYNFLDGIDGYASIQTITMGIGLYVFFSNPLGLAIISLSLGFLIFNWDKASIFMGDVGSASLGFIFSIFIFYDTSNANIFIWLILLSLFWVDATITLIRRFINREKFTQAHKKHAYQRLVQYGYRHSQVVSKALIFNLIFLFLLYILPIFWVFILNILSLISIYFWIETKKAF